VGGRSSAPTQPKRSKFRNVRTTTPDGITHDSKKEAAYWLHLKNLETQGAIRDLTRQIRFPLLVNGIKIGTYIADFRYIVSKTGEVIVGDVKSARTIKLPMYRRNKKHLFAQYGINITEVL